jgi:hypothetical protein
MSEYSYVPTSSSQGEFEILDNPLSQVTEEQVLKNFAFILGLDTGEVIFFKTQEMLKEATKILSGVDAGFKYRIFYCHDVLRNSRLKNTKSTLK